MENVIYRVDGLQERFNDILNAMHARYNYALYARTSPNKYGGNPETTAYFENVVINGIPYKNTCFKWQRATQTEDSFINEIMAYLFEVLDAVANL